MGLLRWAAIIGTGGLAPVKGTSPRERTANAAEKQVRLQRQQMARASAPVSSTPSSTVLNTPGARAAAAAAQARAQALAAGATATEAQTAAQHAADVIYWRTTANTPAGEPTARIASELGRLTDLHKQGALTDDEFATAKAKILAS
jgi:hypothetical protein